MLGHPPSESAESGARPEAMKFHLGLAIAAAIAFVGVAVATGAWLANFHDYPLAAEPQRWAEFGAYFGGTLAPILAFASLVGLVISIHGQARAQNDREIRKDAAVYLENAAASLRRAFDAFTDGGKETVPVSDRLVWLTVARFILAAQSISQKIEVPSVREMYEAEEELWRRRFYEVIRPLDGRGALADAEYFRQGEGRLFGNVIDERSIRVIYEFIKWPEGRADPIDRVARYSTQELEQMNLGMRGIKEYLESSRREGAGNRAAPNKDS